jgi:hypothetical protein
MGIEADYGRGCITSAALRDTRGIVIQLRIPRLASAIPRTRIPLSDKLSIHEVSV